VKQRKAILNGKRSRMLKTLMGCTQVRWPVGISQYLRGVGRLACEPRVAAREAELVPGERSGHVLLGRLEQQKEIEARKANRRTTDERVKKVVEEIPYHRRQVR
jgi:hypothetical protein